MNELGLLCILTNYTYNANNGNIPKAYLFTSAIKYLISAPYWMPFGNSTLVHALVRLRIRRIKHSVRHDLTGRVSLGRHLSLVTIYFCLSFTVFAYNSVFLLLLLQVLCIFFLDIHCCGVIFMVFCLQLVRLTGWGKSSQENRSMCLDFA